VYLQVALIILHWDHTSILCYLYFEPHILFFVTPLPFLNQLLHWNYTVIHNGSRPIYIRRDSVSLNSTKGVTHLPAGIWYIGIPSIFDKTIATFMMNYTKPIWTVIRWIKVYFIDLLFVTHFRHKSATNNYYDLHSRHTLYGVYYYYNIYCTVMVLLTRWRHDSRIAFHRSSSTVWM